MSFIIDHSGRIAKKPTIKDVTANGEVAWCVKTGGWKLINAHFMDVCILFEKPLEVSKSTNPNQGLIYEVILATVRGSMKRVRNTAPQMSAYVLKRAILVFYAKCKLFPAGLCAALPAVDDWALKCGATLKKLVLGGESEMNCTIVFFLVFPCSDPTPSFRRCGKTS